MKEEILNRWAAYQGYLKIAKALGCAPGTVYGHIVRARAAGDPRAISHEHLAAGTDGWRQVHVRDGNGWAVKAPSDDYSNHPLSRLRIDP